MQVTTNQPTKVCTCIDQMKLINSIRSRVYRKSLFLCLLLWFAGTCDAQVFKFRHYLSQDAIHGANFTLNRQTPKQFHAAVPLVNGMNFTITKGFVDTIKTTVPITIVSPLSAFKIRTTKEFNLVLIAGAGAVIGPDTEFTVPAATLINVLVGEAYIYNETQDATIVIAGAFPVPPAVNNCEVKELRTTIVRLTTTTKGLIAVSNGKISFDPWQITSFPSVVPADRLAIDVNTPIPLELKDGRQKISDPTKVLWVPYRHITSSINSIPFRYRAKRLLADTVHATGTVTTAFSLAISVGQTWGWSHITTRARNDFSFTLGGFIGPSSVDLKKETVKTPGSFVAGRTNPVLSYGITIILARNGLGVLLAYGFDNAFGKFGNDWIYDKMPWFGFGVSASFPK